MQEVRTEVVGTLFRRTKLGSCRLGCRMCSYVRLLLVPAVVLAAWTQENQLPVPVVNEEYAIIAFIDGNILILRLTNQDIYISH